MNKAILILSMHNEHDSFMALSTLARERGRISHDRIMKAYNKIWITEGYNYIRLTDYELIQLEKKAKKESDIDNKIAVIRQKQDDDYNAKYKLAQEKRLMKYAIAEKELFALFNV